MNIKQMKAIKQKRLLNDIKMTLEFLIDRIDSIDKVSEPDQETINIEKIEKIDDVLKTHVKDDFGASVVISKIQSIIDSNSKEWQPKTGDIVTVWNDGDYDKIELVYLCTLPNSSTPYCCVSDGYLEHYYCGIVREVWQFENISKLGPKKLTLSEIEEKLGYEIEIIEDYE